MFIIEGIIAGIIATLFFDVFQFSLFYAYNINITKWDLIGRYFIGLKNKKFFYENIEIEKSFKNEKLIGYIVHYIIGAIYGLFYIILNIILYDHPSIFLAILIGFITVLGSWCIIMPFTFNIGFFANKKEEYKQIMVQNLISHFVFGVGLFVGYLIIN